MEAMTLLLYFLGIVPPLSASGSFSPVARATFCVGDRDDLNLVGKLAEDKEEWVAVEHHPTSSRQIWSTNAG
jgi:hypothetical protein